MDTPPTSLPPAECSLPSKSAVRLHPKLPERVSVTRANFTFVDIVADVVAEATSPRLLLMDQPAAGTEFIESVLAGTVPTCVCEPLQVLVARHAGGGPVTVMV